MGDSWQQRAPVSRNFKALFDKKTQQQKKYHNFSIVLRQWKGARDMTGENVPTSCSPPPRLSFQSFAVGSRDRAQETESYHLNG